MTAYEVTDSLIAPAFVAASSTAVLAMYATMGLTEGLAMVLTIGSMAGSPVPIRSGIKVSSRLSGMVVAGTATTAPKAAARRVRRRLSVRRTMRGDRWFIL